MPRFKRTYRDWLRDYFQFSKWQRRATFVSLAIMAGCLVYLSIDLRQAAAAFETIPPPVLQQVQELAVWNPDSTGQAFPTEERWREPARDNNVQVRYFAFDPNTATADEWRQLGVPDRTITSILKYREKGGRFRRPEDLLKIYTLPKDQARQLIPYVTLPSQAGQAPATAADMPRLRTDSFGNRPVTVRGPAMLDINLADTTAWIGLPGIGSRLANRIVNFREKLGGFCSIQQVAETYALPDSTFQKIRSRLRMGSGPYRLLNINTASEEELKAHPYVKWPQARAIVQYRQQHGAFQSVNDLEKIVSLETAWIEKILPYLTTR